MKRISAILLLLVLMALCLPAAAEGNAFRFEKTKNLVFEGETLETELIREGDPAAGELTFESSAPKVATVDAEGRVTGVAKGRVTLTATVKTEKKTYRTQLIVTVARKAESVTLQTEKLAVYPAEDERVAGLLSEEGKAAGLPVLLLPVKKTVTPAVTVEPKDATSRKVTVTSANEAVVRAHANGALTGAAPGEAVVTFANDLSPEVSSSLLVLVVEPVKRIDLTMAERIVVVGGQAQITANITPAEASLPALNWRSENEQLATVDENGVISGLKRGTARITASAADGSSVRASISVKVMQEAQEITLNQTELSVDVGRSAVIKATVMPKDTDDKAVVWTSSNESVAKVNREGRVTGVALGDCEIVCTSRANGEVKATAAVHVMQPVNKIVFGEHEDVWAGEDGKITWTVEPANASNPAVVLSSSNTKVLTVDPDGTLHGISAGEAYVNAISADGSNRRARVRVRVLQHVTGVHMKRHTAYIDVRETASVHGLLEPENASNKNMSWESLDTDIATAKSKQNRVSITGVKNGETTVRGVTEDGGYETTMAVKIGDWDHALKLIGFDWDDQNRFCIRVKNNSNLVITSITVEIVIDNAMDEENSPVPINTKDGSNKVKAQWTGTLNPGEETSIRKPWKMITYKLPIPIDETKGYVYIHSYEVDHDWIKTIREKNRKFSEW